MNRCLKIGFRCLKWFFSVLFLMIFSYALAALILSVIPVNRRAHSPHDLDIYILSNGLHLDMVLPVRNEIKDWTSEVQIDPVILSEARFVSFGWGNKRFFLTTPRWADLTVRTAVIALFFKSPSAIHVDCFKSLRVGKRCKMIPVSNDQYRAIVSYVEKSFRRDSSGHTLPIQGFHYDRFDSFYEATRSYSLFFTCNTWTNRCLKESGLKACLWTPFDKGTLIHY